MALEPRRGALEQDNSELVAMSRRLGVSVVLTIPILSLMFSETRSIALVWIQFAFATPVVLWGGWPFFVRGWQSLVNRH
jgi:Cu+-exporting ATPase